MNRLAVLALRVVVIVIALGSLGAQIVAVPSIASVLTEEALRPDLTVGYAVAGIAVIVGVQVVLLAVWVLLSMVSRDAIFTDRAFRWVDVIIGGALAATLLTFGLGVHAYYFLMPVLDAPGLILMSLVGTIFGVALVLLVIVMRGLLRSATTLRSELAEVV